MWNNYNNFDNKHDNNNININGNKCILFIALYAKVALEKSDRKSEDEKNESIGWILAASGKWASTTFQTKWRLVGFDFSVECLLYS